MGRRTIYVAQERAALFEEAAGMAGSLSGAIDAGIELYVRQVQAGWLRTEHLELTVGRGPALRRVQLRGREVGDVAVDASSPGRCEGATIYQGISGRLAAWRWSDPDWSAARQVFHFFGDEGADEDWYERWGLELTVHEDLDALAGHLDLTQEDQTEVSRRTVPRVVEWLDL